MSRSVRSLRIAEVGLAIVGIVAVSFACYQALQQVPVQDWRPPSESNNLRSNWQSPQEWDPEVAYEGSYREGAGDTVIYGEFNGEPLMWYAKWWTEGEEPGEFAERGGTSAWTLINSFEANRGGTFQWTGWNNDLENSMSPLEAVVPTWRDGAEGAYSLIHDDIGALGYKACIEPAIEVLKEFPTIKTAWGVFVEPADETDWEAMRWLTRHGHEMVNHSYDHTNAAEQWMWFMPGDTLPSQDPWLPEELEGLVVAPLWPDAADDGEPIWPNPETYTVENEVVSITFTEDQSYWTGYDPQSGLSAEDVDIQPQPGAEKVYITVPDETILYPSTRGGGEDTIMSVYVKYDYRDESGRGENRGYIAPTGANWMETSWLEDNFPERINSTVENDQGRPGWVCMLQLTRPWGDNLSDPQVYSNVVTSKEIVDSMVYDYILEHDGGFGPYFAPNKSVEYYVYPFDSYSETSHGWLEEAGYVGARGGAKSGEAMYGDFFHPYAIDYDAFYINNGDTSDVINNDGNNPHQLLTLDGMVDNILENNGYMIRELHSVNKVDDWNEINNPAVGGWWGGLPQELYRDHLAWLTDLVEENRLAVETPTEVVKYRMVANAISSVDLSRDAEAYRLAVTFEDIDDKYKDEISVIVKLEEGVENLAVEYYDGEQSLAGATWPANPRIAPRKLNTAGTAWSVSVNPYLGDAKLLPGQEHPDPDGPKTSIIADSDRAGSVSSTKFRGVEQGALAFNLPEGDFTANIYSASGRIVETRDVRSLGGEHRIYLTSMSLSQGVYFVQLIDQRENSVALTSRFLRN